MGVVADHEKSAVFHLDHLMAVEDGVVAALAGGDPVFDDAVAVAAVADDSVFGGVRGGAQGLRPGGGGGSGESVKKVAAGGHKRGGLFGCSCSVFRGEGGRFGLDEETAGNGWGYPVRI